MHVYIFLSDCVESLSEPESVLSEGKYPMLYNILQLNLTDVLTYVLNIVSIYISGESEGSKLDEAEKESSDEEDITTVQLFARREKKLNEKKERIGTIASKLVEDPENNVNTYYIITCC